MNKDLVHSRFVCGIGQSNQVIVMAVNAAVGNQAQQM